MKDNHDELVKVFSEGYMKAMENSYDNDSCFSGVLSDRMSKLVD